MRLVRFLSLLLAAVAPFADAQIPTIVNEIGELESVRDPKCYATASRLEDFIYGTPLQSEARYEKIALQKKLIRALWLRAAGEAAGLGRTEIGAEILQPVLQAAIPYSRGGDGNWTIFAADPSRRTLISARDMRQYGTVAYALRAILSVQQDAFIDGTPLRPLQPAAVELFKEAIDVMTLAVLQRADRAARTANRREVVVTDLRTAWTSIVRISDSPSPVPPARPS